MLGWLSGCPVVEELTDPSNPTPGRGPEAMVSRYGEINEAFFDIYKAVNDGNSELAEMLSIPVFRKPNEPVGKFEEASVPKEYDTEMAPMATLAGYALPRLFLKEVGTGSAEKPVLDVWSFERDLRYDSALHFIDIATGSSETPNELLARFSELVATHGHIKSSEILRSVLPIGWYEEHQADTMVKDVKRQLELHSPFLWSAYRKMTIEDKQKHGII